MLVGATQYQVAATITDFSTNHTKTINQDIEFVELYPNPATDYVFIKFKNEIPADLTIELRSLIGNKIKIKVNTENANTKKIDISQIPAGHYFLLITNKGTKTIKKFIKRN